MAVSYTHLYVYKRQTLDTYAAPNNGITDQGPQGSEFKKLHSYAIPMN